jgi:large subunit ribosomal protein L18Ae
MGRLQEYQVIGRKLPSEKEPAPKLYRMRIFAPNEVVAKSRFWYYLRQLRKVKKAAGELVSINEVMRRLLLVAVEGCLNTHAGREFRSARRSL